MGRNEEMVPRRKYRRRKIKRVDIRLYIVITIACFLIAVILYFVTGELISPIGVDSSTGSKGLDTFAVENLKRSLSETAKGGESMDGIRKEPYKQADPDLIEELKKAYPGELSEAELARLREAYGRGAGARDMDKIGAAGRSPGKNLPNP